MHYLCNFDHSSYARDLLHDDYHTAESVAWES